MAKRNTSIELLRIILTFIIPCYHWMLYNGIFYAENSVNSIYSLALFSIVFIALYCFLIISSYFLIQKRNKWNASKILSFIALLLVLYVFKTIVVNLLFQGYYMNEYVDSFFLKGSWWYIYPYLFLMLFYPLINLFIYKFSIPTLYIITTILGIFFVILGLLNKPNFIQDCIAFLFVYFLLGCIQRKNNADKLKKNYKLIIWILFIICVLALTGLSLYFKANPESMPIEEINSIIQKIHTRYNILGVIGGLCLFYIVKDIDLSYKPYIHIFSENTIYIFLLHETVMSVFWYFYIKSAEYLAYLPTLHFFALLVIYLVFCILVACIARKLYSMFLNPIFEKLVHRICDTSFIKWLETTYNNLEK